MQELREIIRKQCVSNELGKCLQNDNVGCELLNNSLTCGSYQPLNLLKFYLSIQSHITENYISREEVGKIIDEVEKITPFSMPDGYLSGFLLKTKLGLKKEEK